MVLLSLRFDDRQEDDVIREKCQVDSDDGLETYSRRINRLEMQQTLDLLLSSDRGVLRL